MPRSERVTYDYICDQCHDVINKHDQVWVICREEYFCKSCIASIILEMSVLDEFEVEVIIA